MSENLKKAILENELDESQLEQVAGGSLTPTSHSDDYCTSETDGAEHCIREHRRRRSREGCAATVEDGSWCWRNDACFSSAVDYYGCNVAQVD